MSKPLENRRTEMTAEIARHVDFIAACAPGSSHADRHIQAAQEALALARAGLAAVEAAFQDATLKNAAYAATAEYYQFLDRNIIASAFNQAGAVRRFPA